MEAIGLVGIANPKIPIVVGGRSMHFRALTLREWSQVLAIRIGTRASAYLQAVEPARDFDPEQMTDILLDATYPSDFTSLNDDELESVMVIATDGCTPDLLREHRRKITTILYTINFGGASERSAPSSRDAMPEMWFDVVAMMTGMYQTGVHPIRLLDMTFLQIAAIGSKIEKERQRAEARRGG